MSSSCGYPAGNRLLDRPTGWGANNVIAAFLLKGGGCLIDQMPILFAIGVAVGMSDDNDGTAGLAGLVSWIMTTTLLSTDVVAMLTNTAVKKVDPAFGKVQTQFIGILCGLIAAACYNKFKKYKIARCIFILQWKEMCCDRYRRGIFSFQLSAVLCMANHLQCTGSCW